jgi:hypothetical protein
MFECTGYLLVRDEVGLAGRPWHRALVRQGNTFTPTTHKKAQDLVFLPAQRDRSIPSVLAHISI